MFGAVHFIYCINSSIATKVDSTYLGYQLTAHNVHVFATGGREPVTLRLLVRRLFVHSVFFRMLLYNKSFC